MEMLFSAKWNLPKAAKNCGLTYKEMKITFNEYCSFHKPLYNEDGTPSTPKYEKETQM